MTSAPPLYECLGCHGGLWPDDWVVSMTQRVSDPRLRDQRRRYAHAECYAVAYGREYRYKDEGVLCNLERKRETD